MAAKWADYVPAQSVQGVRTNLLHPNCRCAIQAFQAQRRLPITKVGSSAPAELFTARQFGAVITDTLKLVLKSEK
jgi:hypothetical protein